MRAICDAEASEVYDGVSLRRGRMLTEDDDLSRALVDLVRSKNDERAGGHAIA